MFARREAKTRIEEAERLARRNERNNKIQGVKSSGKGLKSSGNTDDFRNNTIGSKKEGELFLGNGNDPEVMQTKV